MGDLPSGGISACEKSQEWQRALQLLLRLEERRLEEDMISNSAQPRAQRIDQIYIYIVCFGFIGKRHKSSTWLIPEPSILITDSMWSIAERCPKRQTTVQLYVFQLHSLNVFETWNFTAANNNMSSLTRHNRWLQTAGTNEFSCTRAFSRCLNGTALHLYIYIDHLRLSETKTVCSGYSSAILACDQAGEWQQALLLLSNQATT